MKILRSTCVTIVGWTMTAGTALAQVYGGPGIEGGVNSTSGIQLPQTDLRTVATNVMIKVLSFLSLAAVAVIIIAGIYLIVGLGSDESKEKAKKIIQYTLIGLVIVLFSRVIVSIITVFLAQQV